MNYNKLKLNELQYLFESEWGTDALHYAIKKGWRKNNYAEAFNELMELQEYRLLNNGEIKEDIRKLWAKKNKFMLDKIEKMTIM